MKKCFVACLLPFFSCVDGVDLETMSSAVFGDGILDAGEQCDDGNTNSGDGCSATMTWETGFVCTQTEPSVCSMNLITNGDLEGPVGFGLTPASWGAVFSPDTLDENGPATNFGAAGVPVRGANFVGVNERSFEQEAITQTVSGLNTGQGYQLSFWYAMVGRDNSGFVSVGDPTGTIEVAIDAATFTAPAITTVLPFDDVNIEWNYHSIDFVATSSSITFSFSAVDVDGVNPGVYVGLDNIGLVGQDADGDGVLDVDDSAPANPNQCRDTDSDTCDDCTNTGADGSGGDPNNDGLDSDGDGACNAGDTDDDNDGVPDSTDMDDLNPNICIDVDSDSCDDCTNTGANQSGGDIGNDGPDFDGDGLCDVGDGDDDNDGVVDGIDADRTNPNICIDTDMDGCDDCTNTGADGSGGNPANDGPDTDGDGVCDLTDVCPGDAMDECDADGDGVFDPFDLNPTNPNVCADEDEDGCDDCTVTGADGSGGDVNNDGTDTDEDGICNAGDNDDDNDGVPDVDDLDALNANVCRDLDGDQCDDCSVTGADESGGDVDNDGLDNDGDGVCEVADPSIAVGGSGCSVTNGGNGAASWLLLLALLGGTLRVRRSRDNREFSP